MIACVYCGGEHGRPAEVKQCWADHQGAPAVPAAPAAVSRSDAPDPIALPVRRGPPALGRHTIVRHGQAPPEPWADATRVEIDRSAVERPAGMLDVLRAAAHERTGLVVSLATELDPRPSESCDDEPFSLGVDHTFELDELRHLIWSNSIDVRSGEAGRWTAIDRAVAAGASVAGPDVEGDVVAADGAGMWLDGGPIRFTGPIDAVAVVHTVQIEHGRFGAPHTNTADAELASDQLAAVTHPGGVARIIAPAGSGKTRVLTERARHLLGRWNLPPTALTLVAFNKRAQEEMRERTVDLPGLHVRTLNAIALAIVNGSPPFAPQRRNWTTIDEPEVRRILGSLVQTPRKLNIDPLAPWIDALSLVRLGLVAPPDAEVRYGGDVDGLTEVWPQYRAALDRQGAVDFDDQIYRAIETLLTQPEARRAAQAACRVLLVDEFQDLTPAHLLLIRLLAAPGGAVFGVGDDDQTIYGYNGADPAWLIDFSRWFPGAESHPLEVNYRCPAGVVDIADRLLRHNRRRVDKTIRAASADTGGWRSVTSDDPVDASAGEVRDALATGADPADIAVLARVNAALVPVQVALTSSSVPISGGVGAEFLERTAVRAAMAWLRLASGARFSGADVGESLRRPSRGLSPRLRDWASEQRDLDGLERLAARLTNDRDATKVSEFAVDLSRLAGLVRRGASAPEVLDVLVDEIGLGGAVATLDQGRQGMNRSAQGDDLLALRQLARLHSDVGTFERWLGEQLATRRDASGVVLSTVHRVKGQEWPVVVAHLVDADQYPHRLADDVEEERRLLHVAITRCRNRVTIVSGGQPSPFVAELTTEPPEHLPEPAPRPAVRTASGRQRQAPDHPLLDRETVMAVPGLVLVDQGHEWVIGELEPEAAVAARGDAIRRFPIGSKVETAGRQRGRLGARSGEVDEASARLFDLLRAYRDRSRNGKPAYTVFDDKTLAAIATALPDDLAALARVKGVGPAKLEQYGDDVLALAATARSTY
ncbi:ATP-dependent DNA helicase UvrD2 [Ilumatobacter sp.]|uniref:ATP-dependent DNA helicase UvrD2 n=1 Tax=Ilumatobacter sp. TaxID=1967498 RepID=UPI003AF758AF